ncbi:flagellar protein FliS [Tepiditoga spiralis]|uniref:Flagellar secretion chaperone FliS n=1 Tax=Tepiditoga spiralis TaxID=2108365 RepID=A0A7G1G5I5_9BACT|nr:flagellar export chaperone FliS [Tepiditoga spiralis]BBE30546.1 flagellar protein FliS [Tepiditoga spiralis]
MYNQNNNTYFENTVRTATPAKLVEMLYSNAVERLEKSKTMIKEKNFTEANKQIIRVEDIINELNVSLDMEVGGEVSKNLRSLYNYMYRRLLEANVKKDIEIIEEVQGLIKDLLDTWKEAMKKSVNTLKEMSANTNKSKFDIQT